MTLRTIGIISAGDMGSAIGNILCCSGLDVVTPLDGRSDLTRARAAESGMRDVGSIKGCIHEADIVLSVLVPSESQSIANAVTGAMTATGRHPPFVECNAIAPQTVTRIGEQVKRVGTTFIDVGIIGSPPTPNGNNTRFHCSGPDTRDFEALAEYGLDVRPVGSNIGQASGLKMVYAATTKGTFALWTEILVAARALGLDEALKAELGNSIIAQKMFHGIPDTPRRARRSLGPAPRTRALDRWR